MHDGLYCRQHLHHAGVSVSFCGRNPCRGDGKVRRLLPCGRCFRGFRLSSVHVWESGNAYGTDLYRGSSSLRRLFCFARLESGGGDVSRTACKNSFPSDGKSLFHGVFFKTLLPQDLLSRFLFLERDCPALDLPRLFWHEAGARSRICSDLGPEFGGFWKSARLVFSYPSPGLLSHRAFGGSFSSFAYRNGGDAAFQPDLLCELLFRYE